jgi:nicotinamidase-related amidase
MATAKAVPGEGLLDPVNHVLIMIDFQSQMTSATKSIDATTLRNNAALISKAAKAFSVPVVLTTVAGKSFSGSMFAEITSVFPEQTAIDRTSMNTWEDENIAVEINRIGKSRIVLAGLGRRSASSTSLGSWGRVQTCSFPATWRVWR